MIKAVIFDMDGLMVDTEPIQSQAFENTIRFYGKEPEFQPNGLVHEVGVRGDKNFQAMKEKYNISEDVSVLRKKRRSEYEKLLQKGVTAMPGLLQLLELLKQNRISIAIASSSPRKHIFLILDLLGINQYFDVIISGEDVKEGKPNPECFIKASQQLHISPKNSVVIEDAESGANGAKQIDMKVIAVPSKYTLHHNMEKADKICVSLNEVSWEMIKAL